MEERKTMGDALINVVDAAVVLVKAEINSIIRKLTEQAKVKGLGIVFIFAALVPLSMMLIFLILGFFFLLNLWLPLWGSAFVMSLLGLALTAALIYMGLHKLSTEIDDPDDFDGNMTASIPLPNTPPTPSTPPKSTPPKSAPKSTDQTHQAQQAQSGHTASSQSSPSTTTDSTHHAPNTGDSASTSANDGANPNAEIIDSNNRTPEKPTSGAIGSTIRTHETKNPNVTGSAAHTPTPPIQPELLQPISASANKNANKQETQQSSTNKSKANENQAKSGVKLEFPTPTSVATPATTPAKPSTPDRHDKQDTTATVSVKSVQASAPKAQEPTAEPKPKPFQIKQPVQKPAGIPVSTKPTFKDEMEEE